MRLFEDAPVSRGAAGRRRQCWCCTGLLGLLCLTGSAGAAFGQVDLVKQTDPLAAAKKAEEEAAKKAAKEADALEQFKGAGFGAGISLTIIPSGGAGIKSAEIVNGVVRVTEVQHSVPRIILETHYFFVAENHPLRGWGPFLGIQMGSDQIVQAMGAGAMVGFRRVKDKSDSFNFGAGAIYDTGVKTLGHGIREDQPMPTGETAIRYKTDGRWGWLVMFSFGF